MGSMQPATAKLRLSSRLLPTLRHVQQSCTAIKRKLICRHAKTEDFGRRLAMASTADPKATGGSFGDSIDGRDKAIYASAQSFATKPAEYPSASINVALDHSSYSVSKCDEVDSYILMLRLERRQLVERSQDALPKWPRSSDRLRWHPIWARRYTIRTA
jgi:hypothetical protein